MEENMSYRIYRDPWHFRRRGERPYRLTNPCLNYEMKAIAVRECGSVVCIRFRLDGGYTFSRSGFVVESTLADGEYVNTIFTADCISRDNKYADVVAVAAPSDIKISVILSDGATCIGELVGYDLHYNIAAIRVKTRTFIPLARLKELDDSISLDPNSIDQPYDHRGRFRLLPGDTVMALGRHSIDRGGIMVVSGIFSVDPYGLGLGCENLLRSECEIGSSSVGGPLINRYGEVIGINFFDYDSTPFLPINIVSLWWLNIKKNGHCVIPRLGLSLKNMYLYEPHYLELVVRTFPNTFTGVVVDKVQSNALECKEASTKISERDIIIECDEKAVGGTLELLELIWDKVGKPVRLNLLRPDDASRFHVTITVGKVGPSQLSRWPRFGTCSHKW